MKKVFMSSVLFCLLLTTGVVFAQDKTANFAGTWELDTAKSKLPERMRIESGTLSVTQTDKKFKVVSDFKRTRAGATPNLGNEGMLQGTKVVGGYGMMSGGTTVYNLNGKETIVETEMRNGILPPESVSLRAEIDASGKLKLISNRSLSAKMGAPMNIETVETWELLDNGKTLKITRETETPRGSQASEMYFTRKGSNQAQTIQAPVVSENGTVISKIVPGNETEQSSDTMAPAVKTVSAGVVNGKALRLVQPEYPPAAKAVRAGGVVNVQIMFDEQGTVVSAAAVSGHPLLKAAAEKAARQCKFSPVRLSGVPVKVTGIITYNFIL